MSIRRIAALLGVMLVLGASPAVAQAAIPAPDDDPFYAVPANVAGLANGTIMRSRPIAATAESVPMPATSWQLLYKTVDNTGAATATVTTVMVSSVPWIPSPPN
ncbi:MAG: hypothetical protein ACR2HD_01235 [Solirubrobacteraceae bacterium]|nr:MAG: hypothetical protein DLM63_04535 [Solirubrobacterales bacterium]